ncbi:CUS2-like protein [Saccharomyces kudriavzevii IFO 1802]|uniref:CUS2-like protein n=2 Tax=Saccharomyces kudriavzevii (strain ATCC MYA-4449 / AS 2.2408 / CBS 8840 / NBRC 1802 / NCYC 2889) TaxID=226230 RepID=J5RNX2_SACK1|nr:CUS2-like protein [Saccharomyces kudriavzevii IFO 1802]
MNMDAEELELKGQLKNLKQQELLRRKQSKENNTRKREVEYKNSSKSSSVYISGLPTDRITKDELTKQFSKYGKIRINRDEEPLCKLYVNDEGVPKGDALIIYSKEESVTLAVDMMDESIFLGNKIRVEKAQFEDRGSENMDKKESSLKELDECEPPTKKPKQTNFSRAEDVIDYNDDESLAKADRTVVFANVFNIYKEYTPDDITDIQDDLLGGCEEIGQVDGLSVSPSKGEATVLFKKSKDALRCCKIMTGRYFDGQKLLVFIIGDENAPETNDENEESDVEDDLI